MMEHKGSKDSIEMLDSVNLLEDTKEKSVSGEETFVGISKRDRIEPIRGKVYVETYGCQMNFSDSEIVASVLRKDGFGLTDSEHDADIIFLNTCAIRDNAEQKIHHRLDKLRGIKKKNPKLIVGVLGCMAERMKQRLFEEEKIVDLIAGPDAYRSLPQLIEIAESGQKAANVFLSLEETYSDITPIRRQGKSAFLSIMRGCDNMCSFCVVPFTRGRERSRAADSILDEVKMLSEEGFKEITFLGQNVNSYKDEIGGVSFARLLYEASLVDDSIRIRFSTSHPKDISEELIDTIASRPNICKSIHLPVQSGSTRMLDIMNRNHTREDYFRKIEMIRTKIPNCALSTDLITGFCSETEEEHQETLSLLEAVRYDYAFTFIYSERPNTPAAKKMRDDIPAEVKQRRLEEIVSLQHKISAQNYKEDIGKTKTVLIEGNSKRSSEMWMGRADDNRVVVFPKSNGEQLWEYVKVKIEEATSATLIGKRITF
ncbi:MAG: tRNA (N6-isopentenyl adenosine(37)-C2)-methylthiotransferase MiaB [Chloroherpetonaceae bacterium]|nr:tRNA (N6-isopentenyl adenosine(37)-C2)-methylthiotransferase MiaB [Chloroherpetonaceae bacterium]